ncbi:hypothetical protein Tcan_00823, partial [Toxocara canis]
MTIHPVDDVFAFAPYILPYILLTCLLPVRLNSSSSTLKSNLGWDLRLRIAKPFESLIEEDARFGGCAAACKTSRQSACSQCCVCLLSTSTCMTSDHRRSR